MSPSIVMKLKSRRIQWARMGETRIAYSILKFRVFWDIAPCSHFEVDRRFRVAYCLHRCDYTALHPRRL
jgi:hypothetical protein